MVTLWHYTLYMVILIDTEIINSHTEISTQLQRILLYNNVVKVIYPQIAKVTEMLITLNSIVSGYTLFSDLTL